MIKVENIETAGWRPALRGMRNPLNSWDRADSRFDVEEYFVDTPEAPVIKWTNPMVLGPRDESLMRRLIGAGTSDHCKFRRMIVIYCDVTAPLYWWKEFDTYKVGTVANSCSTMHTIMSEPFTEDMFSWEQVNDSLFTITAVKDLNWVRELYLQRKLEKNPEDAKRLWYELIQRLPSSWNQKRTLMLNYEVMANIYKSRRNHKLKEWRVFIDSIVENVPKPWIFTGEGC